MKIGFASRFSPLDKRSWSGITYYTFQQIKKNSEVEIFNFKLPKLLQEWLTTQKSINKRVFKKNTAVEFLNAYSKYFSRQLDKELIKRPVDLLFVSASSQLIAYTNTTIPIIYMTDATFQQLQGYYPLFSNLAGYNIRQGIDLDKRAFEKATHCMLTSEWNKDSAVNDYSIHEDKLSVVTAGANLDTVLSKEEINFDYNGQCRLLFLGVEWERKGGDIALEAFRLLQQKGVNAQLHIIGCTPPYDLSNEKNITVIPFLDKNNTEDFRQLHEIFLHTDILLLPTRAECAGIVFAEASAYGIPSITTDTGGVSTCVKNDVNGYMLPFEAGPDQYAERIIALISTVNKISSLKISSRQYYDEKLNWNLWGDSFFKIVAQLKNNSGFI